MYDFGELGKVINEVEYRDEMGEVEKFKYLRFILQKDSSSEEDIKRWIKYRRMKWRETSDILCDKNI